MIPDLELATNRRPLRLACLVFTVLVPAVAQPQPIDQEPVRHRFRRVQPTTTHGPGFTLMASTVTGIRFTNHLAEVSGAFNRNLANGSGVALGDVDGDGRCDVYLCRLEGDNRLYRNLGDWRFEEITGAAGLGCPGQHSTGAAFSDLDGDNDSDLIVNGLGAGTRTFLNDGQGRFTELTSRLDRTLGAMSLALGDIDGDGDLDLYVANYRTDTWMDRPPGLNVEARRVGDQVVVTPADRFVVVTPRAGGVEVMERGDRDFLYVNDGQGRFAPVLWTSAFFNEDGRPLRAPPTDWGLSVMFRDFNGDLTPDIYVCNDFFFWPDRFWINEESTRFHAVAPFAVRSQAVSAMGMDVADINRDGHDDFLVTDMVSRQHAWRHRQRPNLMQGIVNQVPDSPASRPEVVRNVLQLNRGDGTWADIAQLAGLDFTEWSWGCVFLDADLDGWEDVLIPTGNNHDVQDADALRAQRSQPRDDSPEGRVDAWSQFPLLATPLLAYRNQHDLTFSERTTEWRFGQPGPWQGMALADLDNDGDVDLVVNRLNDEAGVFRNDASAPRVAVRLKGRPPNTAGIGARITVTGGPVRQTQEMIAGGRYLSGDQPQRTFAAGAATNRLQIEVAWRQGWRTVVESVPANCLIEIEEDAATLPPAASPPAPTPWFEDRSTLLTHRHRTDPFDDFGRQPLLSRRLSTLGPGVVWFDLDDDGWDDLVIGGGRGQPLTSFCNREGRAFQPLTNAPPASGNQQGNTAVLVTRTSTNRPVVLTGVPAYGSPALPTNAVLMADWPDGSPTGLAGELRASVGPLALGDVDGDGWLDLFVGARVVPGRYPESVPSLLYRGQPGPSGRLSFGPLDSVNAAILANAGLVSGAVWTDLAGDGLPDLVLAVEWGPIRILRNDGGRLADWNPPVRGSAPQNGRLKDLTGWWTAVGVGDFDGDGRQDLVAANWGRNTRFQRFLDRPLRVYHADLGAGHVELIEAYYEPTLRAYVPWRDYETITRALPWVADHLPTFRAYGEASVETVLGEFANEFKVLEATTLDSVLLLNRDDHLEVQPLPPEAQFAPAFGLAVADFDGDGHDDIFLAQNFFSVEPETSRYDAGRGLLLRGDGQAGFTAVAGQVSGLRLYGQQRGCAVADFDHDGRTDLAVAQHNDEFKLYRNVHAKPGLRVRLLGPPHNPNSIGAIIRLGFGDKLGPAREVRAGAGSWSQDSHVPILGFASPPDFIQVRWPDGLVSQTPVGAGMLEAIIRSP